MSDTYNSSRMSASSKVMFERGRFFIQTGTGSTFMKFWKNQRHSNTIRQIPEHILKRVADFIDGDNKDMAITLWMKACENADLAQERNLVILIGLVTRVALTIMTIYSFFYIMSQS